MCAWRLDSCVRFPISSRPWPSQASAKPQRTPRLSGPTARARKRCVKSTVPRGRNTRTREKLGKVRDHAVKAGKGNAGAIKAALAQLGPPPSEPLLPFLSVTEPTIEGLIKV